MSRNIDERMAWFNGELMPESEVRISFRDRGWLFGDTAFDVARTFGGKPFKLREHVERLYRTLAYLQIDPGMPEDEMLRVSERVLEANVPLLEPDRDYWVGQRISRGLMPVDGEEVERPGATVVVDCTPLPLSSRAADFRDGIEVVVPSVRRTPPEAMSPRAKMCNYINLVLGDLEARARNPRAWAVLLDVSGNLAEGLGSRRRDAARPRGGLGAARVRYLAFRCVQRRRDVPDLDQPLSLSRSIDQRDGREEHCDPGAGDRTSDGGLPGSRGIRFRRAVPTAPARLIRTIPLRRGRLE
jgi:hypothetical protein